VTVPSAAAVEEGVALIMMITVSGVTALIEFMLQNVIQVCLSLYILQNAIIFFYSLRFKMNVALANCTQIKKLNEIIIRHNTFTKMPKKKTKLKKLY